MTKTDTAPIPRLRVGILLWSAGTLGAVTVTVGVLPQLSAKMPLPAPLWLITAASVFQSALLVALAVWGGVALAPAVGLRAPAFEAAALRRPIKSALKPEILPDSLLVCWVGSCCSGPSDCRRQRLPHSRFSSVLHCTPACSMVASRRRCFCGGA
jgi:hypothetical protein